MNENTSRSLSRHILSSDREIFLYNFDNINKLMGEHHKRRYKSGISYDNPFYTGMMVPANLREKPPIQIRPPATGRDQEGPIQEQPEMRVTGGYRNKNLNNLVSSQVFDTHSQRGDYSHRAQYDILTLDLLTLPTAAL